MKKIAVFDIDNTVISNDSWVEFVFTMVRNSGHPFWNRVMVFVTGFLYVCHILPIEKLKNIWLKMIIHMDNENLEDFCQKYVTNQILPFAKDGVKAEIDKLKQEGFVIVFATASLEIYAKYIADFFAADIFVGTKIAHNENGYFIDGKNCKKSEKIVRILQKIDKNQIDVANSVSFSDSLSDLPFLDLTGTFNLVHKTKWQTIKVYNEK